jgi:hypothetical protein
MVSSDMKMTMKVDVDVDLDGIKVLVRQLQEQQEPTPIYQEAIASVWAKAVRDGWSQKMIGLELLEKIDTEIDSAFEKFGAQTEIPDGTAEKWADLPSMAKVLVDMRSARGEVTWLEILVEEVLETAAEVDEDRIEEELIQVIAVAVRWLHALRDRDGVLD